MFSTFVAKKQHLLLKFGRILVFSDNFQENDHKNFFSFFFHFFFVHRLVWNLSFQTHSDSSKNIKNSLFYGILKIFCHLWLRPKMCCFGQNRDFLVLFETKNTEKLTLWPNFKTMQTIRFLSFFAESFTRNTSNIYFSKKRGASRSGQVHTPTRHTAAEAGFAGHDFGHFCGNLWDFSLRTILHEIPSS